MIVKSLTSIGTIRAEDRKREALENAGGEIKKAREIKN